MMHSSSRRTLAFALLLGVTLLVTGCGSVGTLGDQPGAASASPQAPLESELAPLVGNWLTVDGQDFEVTTAVCSDPVPGVRALRIDSNLDAHLTQGIRLGISLAVDPNGTTRVLTQLIWPGVLDSLASAEALTWESDELTFAPSLVVNGVGDQVSGSGIVTLHSGDGYTDHEIDFGLSCSGGLAMSTTG